MHCKICSNEEDNKTHTLREMMFGTREEFTYLECGCCGTIQLIHIPEDMSPYYPPEYYSFNKHPSELYNTPLKKFLENARIRYAVLGKGILGKYWFQRYYDSAPESLSRVKNINKGSKILDVGCGSGIMLYQLAELGFSNLTGADPFLDEDLVYDNGVTVYKKEIEELEDKFDLVMMHHAYEHVRDPQATLKTIAGKLTDAGTVLLRFPVADSYAWKKYGKNWVQLDPPRHTYLYTKKSMELLAKRAGLEITDVVYDSTDFQFWGSEQYQQDISLKDAKSIVKNPNTDVFTPERREQMKRDAKKLNAEERGDQAVFYLKKSSNTSSRAEV